MQLKYQGQEDALWEASPEPIPCPSFPKCHSFWEARIVLFSFVSALWATQSFVSSPFPLRLKLHRAQTVAVICLLPVLWGYRQGDGHELASGLPLQAVNDEPSSKCLSQPDFTLQSFITWLFNLVICGMRSLSQTCHQTPSTCPLSCHRASALHSGHAPRTACTCHAWPFFMPVSCWKDNSGIIGIRTYFSVWTVLDACSWNWREWSFRASWKKSCRGSLLPQERFSKLQGMTEDSRKPWNQRPSHGN